MIIKNVIVLLKGWKEQLNTRFNYGDYLGRLTACIVSDLFLHI